MSKINNNAIMNKSAENPATTYTRYRCLEAYNKIIKFIDLLKFTQNTN